MTDQTIINEHETGLVRVFHVSPETPAAVDTFAFQDAIGVDHLKSEHVQRVAIGDLGDMTLSDFLIAGYDPELTTFAAQRAALDDLTGVVFFVRSSAFVDRPTRLTLSDDVRLITTFREASAPVSFAPLPNPEPQAVLKDPPQKKTPSDAAMGGRVATIALLVMAALVWAMIKIAG